jgi:hypothetical protein
VGPTCQPPLSTPGPPVSAPSPRCCHAPVPRRSHALSAMSGPRASVPTAPSPDPKPPPRCPKPPHCCSSATPGKPCHRAPSPPPPPQTLPPSPRRRTTAGHRSPRLIGERRRRSSFPPPPRRQGAPVIYRLHPHARRVTSPPWVLECRLLLHLRRCSTAAGRAATHARRAVTALACARAPCHRGPRALCTGSSQRCGRGPRALCTRAEPALWAWGTCHCATGSSAVSTQWQSN